MGIKISNYIFIVPVVFLVFKTSAGASLTCGALLNVEPPFKYYQWSELPKIKLSKIVSLKKYSPRYRGFKDNKIETGLVDGKRVFVKTYPRFKNDLVIFSKVVSFNVMLGELGFGTKFLGAGVNENGEPYTVNEFASGRFFRFNQMQWPYPLSTNQPVRQLIRGLRELFEDLSSLGVVVGDFQVFVREDGSMLVVDTDEFGLLSPEKAGEYNNKTLEKILSYLSKLNRG